MAIDEPTILGDSPVQTIMIGGQIFQAGTPGFADTVAEAYAEHRRPRCLCRPGGIEMYIARLNGGYVVKRMPETGNQHAPECPSFELPADLSGLSGLLGGAIVENPVSGETLLRLNFPLSKGPERTAQPGALSAAGSAAARTSRLSLRGLLHYMWDQADLTHWRPAFEGKRSWATVRRHLLRAAEQKIACGNPLLDRLYVPEVFTVDQLEAINARRRTSWVDATAQPSRSQQLMLVIAEVKGIVPGHRGYWAVIKHIPGIAFSIEHSLYRVIGRSFGQELDLWSASDNIHMVMAATFSLNAAGIPAISRLCLLPVTKQWLPVESILEQQLVERLVREGKAFTKILRYDLARSERIASVALATTCAATSLLFADIAMGA